MAHLHSVGQWAAVEVTSAWLISVPIKSQPFPVLLTPAHEVTTCVVFNHSCSPLPQCHQYCEKAQVNAICLETKIRPTKTGIGKEIPAAKWPKKGKYIDTLTCSELVHTNTERRQPIWCCYQKYYQKRTGKVIHLTFFPSSILSFSPLATRGHFGASSLRPLEILSFHKYLNIGSGVSGWGWNESESITKGETWGFYRAERWVPKIFSSNILL